MRFWVLLGTLLLGMALPSAQGALRVAFLRQYDRTGQVIRLEAGGPGFYHVALEVAPGRWLHAHPWGGVQVSADLSPFGQVEEILEDPRGQPPAYSQIQGLLWLPYDRHFQWGGGTFYCSELIAHLLGVEPVPMRFGGEHWRHYFERVGALPPVGQPGVSPDRLYRELVRRGFERLVWVRCPAHMK